MYLSMLAAISYNNDIIRYNKFVTGVQPRFQALTTCGGKTLAGAAHMICSIFLINYLGFLKLNLQNKMQVTK